jgi:subtilase family serine protease
LVLGKDVTEDLRTSGILNMIISSTFESYYLGDKKSKGSDNSKTIYSMNDEKISHPIQL